VPVTVVRSGNAEVVYLETLVPERDLLLFDPVEERGQFTLGDRFRSLDRALQNAEVIIFRSSSRSMLVTIQRDPILRSILGKRDVLYLGRSYDPSLPGTILLPAFGRPPIDLSKSALRQAELSAILRWTNAVYEDDNHHYHLPSGWHADKFVRLGNACCSVVDNRRIADWVLGHVSASTDLLADTGTILPLLQEVQRHCQHKFGWNTKIDALGTYPGMDALVNGVDDLRARSQGRRDIAFVVSVNSSGGSYRRFEKMIASTGRDSTIVICETNPAAIPRDDTLVLLPSNRWKPESNGKCKRCGSPALVVVHPSTYEPSASYTVRRSAVTGVIARKSASLFESLSASGAVRLHYDSDAGSHYSVWIDTPVLLNNLECNERFSSFISELETPDLVLVPDGPASEQLVFAAKRATRLDPVLVLHDGPLAESAIDSIQRADHILIVDDTIVSGTTLGMLRVAIYRAAQLVGRNPRVSVAVFLARPSRRSDMRRVNRPYMTSEGANIHALFEALLPTAFGCSFCSERSLLRAWYERLTPRSQATASDRLAVLDTEMRDQLFLGSSGGPDLVEAGSLLTAGSFFGELSESTGFAAASSAVQTVLDSLETMRGALSAKIIDIAAALDAYFDPCLLVGILRTTTKDQVRFATEDSAIVARYATMAEFGGALTDVVRCEMGWAALREVIPLTDVDAILSPVKSPQAELIRELLALRQAE